jgi:glucose-1-phosphate adenylyltransferase
MGADYYQDDPGPGMTEPPIGIGRGCKIDGAIIDKNARIGENVTISKFPPGTEINTENWVVQDGIVVIPKNAIIPAGTIIQP